MTTEKSASPFDVRSQTVEDLESMLRNNDYSEVELRALRSDEQNRTDSEDTRSTAIEAIDEALANAVPTEGESEGVETEKNPNSEPVGETSVLGDNSNTNTDAVTKAMDESEFVIGQRVEVRSTSGPYVAGLWFDDGLGMQTAEYNRRLAEAVEDGDAKIVGVAE